MNDFYVYVYLDPRKPGEFNYGEFNFSFEPFYIGKGSTVRIDYHYKKAQREIKKPNKTISKIKSIISNGLEPIRYKITENLQNPESLLLEIKLIKLIGRNDLEKGPLTNQTDGGDGAINTSKETRLKLSNSLKQSEKHKQACKNPDRNKSISDKLKNHAMYKNPGRGLKISNSLIGKPGHAQNQQTRILLSENNARYWKDKGFPVFQFSLDGTFLKQWNSARHVERELGFRHDGIGNCCKNKAQTAHGFIWKYTK